MDQLTQRDIQNYLMSIMDEVSGETVNGSIRVFRVFYRHLMAEGLIKSNPMDQIRLVRTAYKIKTVITTEEMSNVLSQFDRQEFHGARDYCMVLLAYDSMLRLSELLTVKLSDLDLTTKLVKVTGKGRKQRYVPFSDKTAKSIHTYLVRHRKRTPGDLLFPMLDGAQIKQRRAHRIFAKAGTRAGVYMHPHLVRHSSASQFIRMGGNPAVLQRVLGHSSLTVTQRYVHLSNDDMNRAYETFSPVASLRG